MCLTNRLNPDRTCAMCGKIGNMRPFSDWCMECELAVLHDDCSLVECIHHSNPRECMHYQLVPDEHTRITEPHQCPKYRACKLDWCLYHGDPDCKCRHLAIGTNPFRCNVHVNGKLVYMPTLSCLCPSCSLSYPSLLGHRAGCGYVFRCHNCGREITLHLGRPCYADGCNNPPLHDSDYCPDHDERFWT